MTTSLSQKFDRCAPTFRSFQRFCSIYGWRIALMAIGMGGGALQWTDEQQRGEVSLCRSFHLISITNGRMCLRTSIKEAKSCEVKGTKAVLLSRRTEHKGSWKWWRWDLEAGITRKARFSANESLLSGGKLESAVIKAAPWLGSEDQSTLLHHTLCVEEKILYRPDEYFFPQFRAVNIS